MSVVGDAPSWKSKVAQVLGVKREFRRVPAVEWEIPVIDNTKSWSGEKNTRKWKENQGSVPRKAH